MSHYNWRHHMDEYWQYQEKLDTCAIGYPSNYDPKTPRGNLPGHSIVPTTIKIPNYLKPLDKAMLKIPGIFRKALKARHTVKANHDKKRAAAVNMKYSTFRLYIRDAEVWLDGYFIGSTERC